MTAYWELLKDPRWQRLRLEVMERAGFRCEDCADHRKTLNVHHSYYLKNRAPWEYPSESLVCLCEDCHVVAERQLAEIKQSYALRCKDAREMVLGFVRAINAASGPGNPIPLESYGVACGVVGYYREGNPADALSLWLSAPDGVVDAFDAWSSLQEGETIG